MIWQNPFVNETNVKICMSIGNTNDEISLVEAFRFGAVHDLRDFASGLDNRHEAYTFFDPRELEPVFGDPEHAFNPDTVLGD